MIFQLSGFPSSVGLGRFKNVDGSIRRRKCGASRFKIRKQIAMPISYGFEIGSNRPHGVRFLSRKAAAEREPQNAVVFHALATASFQNVISLQAINAQQELFPTDDTKLRPISRTRIPRILVEGALVAGDDGAAGGFGLREENRLSPGPIPACRSASCRSIFAASPTIR